VTEIGRIGVIMQLGGSIQSSSGRCYPDLHRRIGLASSASRCNAAGVKRVKVWTLQFLLYGADTWTPLADDTRKLQSFHVSYQRQILGVKWQDHVKNVDMADRTGLLSITDCAVAQHCC